MRPDQRCKYADQPPPSAALAWVAAPAAGPSPAATDVSICFSSGDSFRSIVMTGTRRVLASASVEGGWGRLQNNLKIQRVMSQDLTLCRGAENVKVDKSLCSIKQIDLKKIARKTLDVVT